MIKKSWEETHTHFEVREEAETLKNVASDSDATALASMVFPLPGGPKRRSPENPNKEISINKIRVYRKSNQAKMASEKLPLAGLRRPVKRSFLFVGRITISRRDCFAFSRPAAKGDHEIEIIVVC